MPTFRSLTLVTPCVLALGLVGACGSDDGSGGIEASGAWARTSPMMADAGAAYMVLSSDEAVSIVSASAPAEVAGSVELHETVPVDEADDEMADDEMAEDEMAEDEMAEDEMAEDEMADGDMADGDMAEGEMAMMMREVSSIDVPAGGEVVLEPGGMHVMLLELPDPLEAGETFDLTLVTDAGDEIVIDVEVRDEAP